MKRTAFEKHLKKHNCQKIREGSNHSVWANKFSENQSSVARHNELSNIICKEICKQLGIPSL